MRWCFLAELDESDVAGHEGSPLQPAAVVRAAARGLRNHITHDCGTESLCLTSHEEYAFVPSLLVSVESLLTASKALLRNKGFRQNESSLAPLLLLLCVGTPDVP